MQSMCPYCDEIQGYCDHGNKEVLAAESLNRWDMYNYYTSPDSRARIDAQNLSDIDKRRLSTKEGIGGLIADINKGIISPHYEGITRQHKKEDSKREHTLDQDSIPLYLELLDNIA